MKPQFIAKLKFLSCSFNINFKKALVFSLTFSFIGSAHALVDKAVREYSAKEIIKIPYKERKLVLTQQNEKLYNDLKKMAFSPSENLKNRWNSLMSMALLKKKNSISDLYEAANGSEWFMKNAALLALNEINPDEAVILSKKLVKDPSLVVRSAAVDILKLKERSSSVRELLWGEINQKYNYKGGEGLWIREQIAKILAENPTSKERAKFIQLIKAKDASVHSAALSGFEKIVNKKFGKLSDPITTRHKLCLNYINKI